MNDLSWHASVWLLRTLTAGGLLLLLSWFVLRVTRDAGRRQRLAAWTFRGAVLTAFLGLFPAWLMIPITLEEHDLPVVNHIVPLTDIPVDVPASVEMTIDDETPAWATINAVPQVSEVEPLAVGTASLPDTTSVKLEEPNVNWYPWLLGAYGLLAGFAGLQLLIALIALVRLRSSSKPANESITALAHELAGSMAVVPRVMVTTRISTPVCFGSLSPTILLPQSLAASATEEELRWVLAHELDHLRRGDPRTGLWVGFARMLFFAVPWYWAVRRELLLAQEYLADAAAAAGRPADYAAFLVCLSEEPVPHTPLGAMAVRARPTDLYRRVSMLTQGKQASSRSGCSRAWSFLIASGVLSTTVALSGIGFADDQNTKKVEVVVVKGDEDTKVEGKKIEKKEGGRDVTVTVAGMKDEIRKLTEAVTLALEKGDIAAAKDAMEKLNKALSSQPRMIMLDGFAPAMPLMPAMPQPPGVPLAPVPSAAPAFQNHRARIVDDADVKKLEETLKTLKQSIERMKDSPEAREALEKTIAEFKQKLDEARKAAAAAPRKFGAIVTPLDDAAREKLEAGMAAAKADMVRVLEELEAKMAKTGGDKEALEKFKAERDQLLKLMEGRLKGAQRFDWVAPGGFNPENAPFMTFRKAPAEGRFGITIDAIPEVLIDQLDLGKGTGVIITSVVPGSAAEKAGIRANDILVQMAGKAVSSDANDLVKLVNSLKADEKFEVVVVRKGKKETIKDVVLPAIKDRKPRRDESDSDNPKAEVMKFNTMIVNVNNGQFEIEAANEATSYKISGHFEDGRNVCDKVRIKHGKEEQEYKDLEKLPKSDRAAVEQLLKSVSGSSR